MDARNKTIPLHRTFVRVTENGRDRSNWGRLRELASASTWAELLEYSCVVVLGEAGLGKTSELRAQKASIVESGRTAFFLRVEELAKQGVRRALARDRSFASWRDASNDSAWFMLDAVDESVLKGHTLADALNNLCDELGPQLSRVRLVVSSRASDWRSSDEAELRALANGLATSSSSEEQSEDRRFALVQLAPLNEAQITALCLHWGTADVDAFLEAVRDSNAWSFLERPLDVQWLSHYWNERGRLGSLRELVEFNIDERLKEKGDRPTLISVEKAQDGAAFLALVAALSRRSAFLVPGEALDPRAEDALDPRDVLSDWRNEEIQDLLARGLFDEATYGRVRVHHRSVHEYLAARRLARMLEDGSPRTDLHALFFRKSSGYTVVPPHLTAILAWLAGADPELRRLATCHAPECLVDEGDPAEIPAIERQNILRAYVERFGDRERIFHHFDSMGLQRFASVELSTTIRELLTSSDEPDHIRELLLRLVKKGRLAALADEALAQALAPATSAAVRLEAIRAVCSLGIDAVRVELRKLLATPAAQEPEVAAALLDGLFPTVLTVSDAVNLLDQVVRPSGLSVTSLDVLVSTLPGRCAPDARREFLAELLPLLRAPRSRPGHPEVNPRGVWLAECVTELVRSIAGDGEEPPETFPEVLELLREAEHHPDHPPRGGLSAVLEHHPELRRRLFWAAVEALRETGGKRVRTYWDAMAARACIGLEDLRWLREDARTQAHVRDRVLAFDCAWHVAHDGIKDPEQRLSLLSRIADESDAVHGDGALARKLRRKQNPPPFPPMEAFLRTQLQTRARDLRRERITEENRQKLNSSLSEIESGAHTGALYHLFERFHLGEPSNLAFSRIAEEYGSAVADAARQGFKVFWRINDPPRVCDYELHQTPYGATFGLLGIGLDVGDGMATVNLPLELRRSAIGYAIWELNRFPSWFEDVARDHGELVAEVLAEPMRRDYVTSAHGRVLPKLSGSPEAVRRACSPILAELLRHADPPDIQVLKSVLEALEGTDGIPASEMAILAGARCRASEDEPRRFAVWWCQWLKADAIAAFDALEVVLGRHAEPREMAEEVFSWLWALAEPRSGGRCSDLRSNRDVLIRLIPIVHTYIRTEDDIHHPGAHVVGRRDDCQDLRRALIGWLSAIEGAPTVEALQRFASEPWFAGETEWLQFLAERRAADDAAQAFSVAEAASIVRSGILEPATAAELFDIVLKRLEDIRLYLAHGDFSVRERYNPPDGPVLEMPVQNLLAQSLEERRRKQYTVAREPEVTREKKPDIRLAHPSCEGPVTLEVKIAERWTIRALEEAICDQLVGQYMKDNSSRYGVLVLCSSGPAKKWRNADSRRKLDFQELLQHLCHVAANLASTNAGIGGLRIVAIDFH